MRIGSFLLGSALGASAVWIMSNRNHPIVSMMKMMTGQVSNQKQQQSSNQKDNQANVAFNAQTREENTSLIRSIIENDPKLKQQFDSISKEAMAADSQGSQSHIEQAH